MVERSKSQRQLRRLEEEERINNLANSTEIDPMIGPLEVHDLSKHTIQNPATLYRSVRHVGDKF